MPEVDAPGTAPPGPRDPFTEAYWRALYRIVGEGPGRILRSVLLAGAKEGPGPEWQRVHADLQVLLGSQAKGVLEMAAREADARRPPDLRGGPSPG